MSASAPGRLSQTGGFTLPDNILKFHSAREIAESEPEEQDYVVEQLLIKGAITSFSAKIKAGKTTFLGACIKAILTEDDIINLATRRCKVLYCTEEGRKTYRAFLKRTELEDADDLEVLFLGDVPRELPWRSVVHDVFAHALSVNAFVVIFDTLTRWARIPADKENDPGTAAEAMEPLEIMRAGNIAIMAVFHDRKSGGEVGESQRGSSAFGGAADILLQLVNPATNGHPNRRTLSQLGRFDDPTTWQIDWHHGHYEVVGMGADLQVERNWVKEKILSSLVLGPLTTRELGVDVGIEGDSGSMRRALNDLEREGRIARTGTGKRGDSYRFSLLNITPEIYRQN